MLDELAPEQIAKDFAAGLELADSKRPVARNSRSGALFQPGIGPHSEAQAVALVMQALSQRSPQRYAEFELGVPYPNMPRQRCDLCIGRGDPWKWAIEVKMLRFLGDNGGINDSILMHVLSPYPEHRSALTDCDKLARSGFGGRRAILIYGFDHDRWPLDPAVDAFETLARARVNLGPRAAAEFSNLIHPIHDRGRVFVWELRPSNTD